MGKRLGSVKGELVRKSKEAAIAAVQIFNNPNSQFKSEIFIVLMIISWTYLLHAYYREKKIIYRYKKGRKYIKTRNGADRYWDLTQCLCHDSCPIDRDTKNNLKFLIELRHEIEHQMTKQIDDSFSAKFQACCINYNRYLKILFGDKFGIEKHLSLSLQFSGISNEQMSLLETDKKLPTNIKRFLKNFEDQLSEEEYESESYAYRIYFTNKLANYKGQADRVIEFMKSDSPEAKKITKDNYVLKETEKIKYKPSEIVSIINKKGYTKFKMHHHTNLWKEKDGKNIRKGYGHKVSKEWFWYESWLNLVEEHCKNNKKKYE